jgi:hypothetical protein
VPLATKPAAPQLSKAVSAYASSKTTALATTPVRTSPTTTDTASKASNAVKPRAPVSEGVRKTPTSARQSLAGKLPPTPKAPTGSATKPSRTAAQAESSKAPKEDKDKLLEEIKIKASFSSLARKNCLSTLVQLKETTESLEAKSDAFVEIEGEVSDLPLCTRRSMPDVAFS